MDSKRKFSPEKEPWRSDGKRKKVVTPVNQEAGGSGGDGNVAARSHVNMEFDGLINVPIVSSEEIVLKKNVVTGGSSGERLTNDLSLERNESVEVHVTRDQETNKIKDKGKSIIIIDDDSPKKDTISTTSELHMLKDNLHYDFFWLKKNGGETHNCEHFWIWKQEDNGHVCWICGIIEKKDPILAPPGYGSNRPKDIKMIVPIDGLAGTGIFLNPWHQSLMKPHHMEIMTFLCSNLAVENPNGCILAQAPVSEKLFLMICFFHGYLSKHPNGKPLFLLPKGMIDLYKKKFDELKINDITFLDFYSSKGRSQQLDVLNQWFTTPRSILFCGHKHFHSMMSRADGDFKKVLLKGPSIVIYDRGTDPRNTMMNFLKNVSLFETPNKILLTGSLHQNHLREVFNLFDVVSPNFLRNGKPGKKLRQVLNIGDADELPTYQLFDGLQETLLSEDTDHGDKIGILTELRMLTKNIIYSHSGEFHLEVPGLMDYTVVLNLSGNQMSAWESEKSAKSKGFKTYSTLSGITLHPVLGVFSDRPKDLPAPNDDEMDVLLKYINVEDGVKTKFLLGLVKLCSITNEKILVVSQYQIPLIFLQRLLAKIKGWQNGKEMFILKGDTRGPERETSVKQFNDSHDAKVFFASIKSCNEPISLTGATRIISLDINSSLCLVRQAIELAYQIGQQKKVYSYRLIAADTSEEEEDIIAATREMVAGVWLDGKSYPVDGKFQIPAIEGKYASDHFLGASYMRDDIKCIYKR